ncbi:MAG: PepSY domain-containing protein [Treponema sp.]|jgi:uncharacterized membrane protein YkoI|nr:PepSY domain-containing protein [Treponema sp.]
MRRVFLSFFAVVVFAAAAHAQAISAAEASERAVSVVGGGTLSSLELINEPAFGTGYQIVIINAGMRYEIFVSAATGDILRLVSIPGDHASPAAMPVAAAPAPAALAAAAPAAVHLNRQGINLTELGITPGSPPHWFRIFRPRNPPVSRASAVEIGYIYLRQVRGISHATFRRHSGIERDYGRWAWELYFMDGWTEIELYIDMHSGDVVVVRFDS